MNSETFYEQFELKIIFLNFSDLNFTPKPVPTSLATVNQAYRVTGSSGGGDGTAKAIDHTRIRVKVAYIGSIISGLKSFYEVSNHNKLRDFPSNRIKYAHFQTNVQTT